jgi:hypothetical protein
VASLVAYALYLTKPKKLGKRKWKRNSN